MTTTLLPRSVRNANPHAQIKSLVTIGRRAILRADWIEVGLGERRPRDYHGSGDPESFFGYLAADELERARYRRERDQLRQKVDQAAAEIQAIAQANGIRPTRPTIWRTGRGTGGR